ncbi:MAG: phosphoribosyltransferase family protein [Candidatus Gracilibacteria bacterium]|nr:phosphoribosyltransferase family protein [Candidatus Gracilibacteria bacterium]
MKIFKFFLDLIAPKKCYSCKKEGHFICQNCYNYEVEFNTVCYVCKGKTKNFEVHDGCKKDVYYDKVIILKHYKSKIISKLVKDAKFYNKKEIFEEFSDLVYDKFLLNNKIINLNDFVVISIPSYFTRKIFRGYNSSDIFARFFSGKSKIIYLKNVVKKIRYTKQQSKLSKKERIINLKDSFVINQKFIEKIKNKNVIILDDVISTGTTLNEISKLLKNNGVKYVIGLIVASD